MSNTYQIYLISDSTGETLDRIFLALKAQFVNIDYNVHSYSFTRTENQILKILEDAKKNKNSVILYTIVDNNLAKYLANLSNEKKIDAIDEVVVTPGESLFGNAFIHGQNIRVVIKSENFQCAGDKYVFGSVLDRFFAGTAAINVYSELTFEDFFSGERLQWSAKIGNRPLQ